MSDAEEKDPQSLVEQTANLMSAKFIESLEGDVKIGWVDIANSISADPATAKRFFSKKTIKLAQIYTSSMNLFVEMDENSDLISGIVAEEESEEEEGQAKTRFDFDELLDEEEE
jgi:hypothetical protein